MKKKRGSDHLSASEVDGRVDAGPPRFPYAWLVYLVLGVVLAGAYYALPLPGAARDSAVVVLSLSPVAASMVGIWVYRPARPGAWYLLLGGLLGFVAGDALWGYEIQVLGFYPLSLSSSVFYLAGYALLFSALLILARERSPDGDRSSLLDAAIVATGTGMLSWTFLAAPYLRDSALPATERLLLAVYPVIDILLLAALVRFFLAPGPRVTAYRLLCLGLGALLVSDAAYSAERLVGASGVGSGVGIASEVGWSLFHIFWGAAALHPSMRRLTRPALHERTDASRKRLVLLAAASLLAPGALAVQAARGAPTEIPVLIAGSVLLFSLVLARMENVQRSLISLLEKRERAETELRSSERRFRQLFDQSVDALIVFDERGDIRDCNLAACRALGYSREELLELNVRDVSEGEGLLTRPGSQERRQDGETLRQRYTAGEKTIPSAKVSTGAKTAAPTR